MGRIFITGDTHQDLDIKKLNSKNFPLNSVLTKEDILIICGDWGCIWDGSNNDKYWQQWYENKNFTTFVVLGNHENYNLIKDYPIVDFCGGKARKVSDSVYLEVRGEVYTFNGKTFLSLGGAESSDKAYRKEGVSWWSEEKITPKDVENALKNAERYEYIDYVITHTGGTEITSFLGFPPTESDELLQSVLSKINYGKHYGGHYHGDLYYGKHRIIYDDVCELVDYAQYFSNKED